MKDPQFSKSNDFHESSKLTGVSNRQFNDLPTKFSNDLNSEDLKSSNVCAIEAKTKSNDLFELIAQSEIGRDQTFSGPFGLRKVTYCDYTATGRSLSFIEDFIRNEVLPEYGNTHTTSTITSLQTTLFRNEAKDIIRNSVNASEHDDLIFAGSGCTSAIHVLVNALDLTEPPIVFVSPFEHHSNLLPWRETFAEIVYINEQYDGQLDLQDLEEKLKNYSDPTKYGTKLKIGCFTAASNITGSLVDTNSVSILLHKYGSLAFWDYATAAPHVHINMNPVVEENQDLVYKDAIYLSCHKFIGGPQTPGILIAKKSIFKNKVPYSGGGGGSVFYVTKKDHRYLLNDEMREESGTPEIVGSIRAGLVFQFKNAIGTENIIRRENAITNRATEFLKNIPNLRLLGNVNNEKVSIFSFLVQHEESGLFLHSNFVSSLLNDLFGIQSRSGCMCAGPYAQYLLGISYELAKTFEEILVQDSRLDRDHLRIKHDTSRAEILRPGLTRLNFPYFASDAKITFILEAVKFVCENAWKFLPLYIFNLETGEWRHRNHQVFKDRKWLGNIDYKNNEFNFMKKTYNEKDMENFPKSDEECLKEAYKALETTKETFQMSDQRLVFSSTTSNFRWFLLSSEAYGIIHSNKSLYNNERYEPVFEPRKYTSTNSNPTQIEKSQNHSEKQQKSFSDFMRDDPNQMNEFTKLVRKEVIKEVKVTKETDISCPLYPKNSNGKKKVNTGESLLNSFERNVTINSKSEADLKVEEKFKHKWHHPHKAVFKNFTQAIDDFSMIKDGDRILVCLSGGKDSMSLLHAIKQYQYVCKSKNIKFEFGAVTVDPKTSGYNPSALKPYLAELGVPYFYEEQCIIESAANLSYECASICSFCSRMKRGRIYSTARKNGYNVLALGQHLDDFSESFMMSLFYNGKLWCMKAHYKNEQEDLRVIRPLVYVREKELRAFAESNSLPIIPENCPACFEAPKERMRLKQLLAQQELNFPSLFGSILTAIKPIISINKCQISVKTLTEFALKLIQSKPELYEELVRNNKDSSELIEDSL